MKLFKSLTLLLLLFSSVNAEEGWRQSQYVDDATWSRVSPYLLSSKNKIKKQLDEIFSKSRVSTSLATMRRAGFICKKVRKWSNILVATHPKLTGYLVKLYLDDQIGINDFELLVTRVEGARAIKEAINQFGYRDLFKVPKKYLYVLPDNPPAKPELHRKNFILVVEEMQLRESNRELWKGTLVSKRRLQALYHIVTELGLLDSLIVSNIPFCTDGRNAFIDTEHHHKWPIPYHHLLRVLNPEKSRTWEEIVNHIQ